MAVDPRHRQSVAERLRLIARQIRSGSTEPCVRRWVGMILRGTDPTETKEELSTVYKWVKRNIRFAEDPVGFDAFYSPCITLESMMGDCDDQTIVIGSILMNIGYRFKVRAISRNGRTFDHVYGLAGTDISSVPSWVSMDTVFGQGPGRGPSAKLKMEVLI